MTVNDAKGILENVSQWNGESQLLVEVAGECYEIEVIRDETYRPGNAERRVRIIAKK